VAAGASLTLGAAPARAQGVGAQGVGTTVRVQVTDSAARPLGGVEVLVMAGLQTVLARRGAGEDGRVTIAVPPVSPASEGLEVVARRIGFARASTFLRAAPGDTLEVRLALAPLAQRLATTRVTARADAKRRSYYIDADAIAESRRPIGSALDVMAKLRPDMLTSRAGWRVCGTVREVWVNGRRIPQNLVPDPMVQGRPLPGVSPRVPVPAQVLTILHTIRPEHIAEMTYHDCFDRSIGRNGSENAVFIVLKPGVEYRWPDGTFVVPADSGARTRPPERSP
jgi:hypothetical protein